MKRPNAFIWGIIYFCTMDGFFRILEKRLSELICTRLYVKTQIELEFFCTKSFQNAFRSPAKDSYKTATLLAWILSIHGLFFSLSLHLSTFKSSELKKAVSYKIPHILSTIVKVGFFRRYYSASQILRLCYGITVFKLEVWILPPLHRRRLDSNFSHNSKFHMKTDPRLSWVSNNR